MGTKSCANMFDKSTGNMGRATAAACKACWVMAVASAAAIVGFAVYYGIRAPAGPPVQYYITIEAPHTAYLQQPTHTLLAEAVHSALDLPITYPVASIAVWQVHDLPADPVMTPYINASANSSSRPAAGDQQPHSHMQQQQVQQHSKLAQPDEANKSTSTTSRCCRLLFGVQLFPRDSLPDARSLDSSVTHPDGNAAVLLYLVILGLIDPAALGQITAGFSNDQGIIYGVPAGKVADASIDLAKELLQYRPRPMPDDACTCRHGWNMTRVPMSCPSPWESMAETSSVAPALTIKGGALVELPTGQPAALHGINWFGWNEGTSNPDGLWAYCDNNATDSVPPCQQDGDIPPIESVGYQGARLLNISYWGRRRMTNDFATVVYRMKLLGFTAIRMQFRFSDLNIDLPAVQEGVLTENSPCLLDSDAYIALNKTRDPLLATPSHSTNNATRLLQQHLPQYLGMPHPPPKTGSPQCDRLPWSVPFLADYTGGQGRTLNLTMCNWYLPQGPGVPALKRFLWQLQYMVSQGFYVILDFSSSRDREPNLERAELLAQNWGNLWRMLTELPAYTQHLAGRLFPDLVNEPSRYGCQWDTSCYSTGSSNSQRACAPILQAFGLAAAAIWRWDPTVPIFINGLGQDYSSRWRQCGHSFPGMHWGDGFITNAAAVQQYSISNPSRLLKAVEEMPGPGFVLAPHLYPASITTDRSPDTQRQAAQSLKWDLSWGFKAQGTDVDSQGLPLPSYPVVVGEFGVRDWGMNNISNTDTTSYSSDDRQWLTTTAGYVRALARGADRPLSWFFWAWNANSGDTHGVVGPQTTWREIQWTKVRMLVDGFGLQPWYCKWQPQFCDSLQ